MKRPLLSFTVGYILGIVWGLYCSCSIAFLYIFLGMFYMLIKLFNSQEKRFKLFSLKRYFRYIKIFLNFNVIVILLISSFISNLIVINQNKKYNTLYTDISSVTLTGTIVSNRQEKENINVYTLKVDTLNESLKFKNTYLLLRVRKNVDIEYGDKVNIKGEYVEPSKQTNYKGFDYKEFLKTKKIYGIVKASDIKVVDKKCNFYILTLSNNIFLQIKNNIEKIMPNEMGALTLGIMLGYTDDLDENVKQQFSNSHMAHILAVSGMHITYITVSVLFVLKPIFGKRKSKLLAILVLIFYMLITGFSPSIVRAIIMHIIVLAGGIFYRKNDVWNSLSISLLVILLYNPYQIKSISLLLSYGGTIGLITINNTVIYLLKKIRIKNKKYKYKINKKLAKTIKFIRESTAMAISVNIIIIPIFIIYYNKLSFTFLITNVFLSIFVGPIIALGLLILICSIISSRLVKIFSFLLIPLLKILEYISKTGNYLPFSKIYISTPNLFEIIMYYVLIFIQNFIFKIYRPNKPSNFEFRIRNILSLIRYSIKQKKKVVLPSILIICIIFSLIHILPKDLKIYFIDVGQGDSTLIVSPMNRKILIDGGGSTSEDYDIGKNVLIPYLLDRRITKIDYIIISHFDQDHVGGLLTVMEELRVGEIIISKQSEESENFQKFKEIVNRKKIKVTVIKKGDRLPIEKNLYFDFLWPNESNLISENGLNNNSIVCKLNYNSFSCLFTGDIEKEAETQIIKEYGGKKMLNSTVLKVAHHGSKTSSSEEFLKAVLPKIALIGVGKNNLFGHPNKSVIDRLESVGAKIYRTDQMGEISITVNKKGYTIHNKLSLNSSQ